MRISDMIFQFFVFSLSMKMRFTAYSKSSLFSPLFFSIKLMQKLTSFSLSFLKIRLLQGCCSRLLNASNLFMYIIIAKKDKNSITKVICYLTDIACEKHIISNNSL